VLLHEFRHIAEPAPAARLADDRQHRLTKVGQDKRAVVMDLDGLEARARFPTIVAAEIREQESGGQGE
jgi:hypothetical protein